jgi:hypothetical protein
MYTLHHADKQSKIYVKHTEPSRYNTRGNGSNILNKLKPNTWLDTNAWHSIT